MLRLHDNGKTKHFRSLCERLAINPARACACGDEQTDFQAAVNCYMHPFMVSYGFEDYERLIGKLGVPPEVISRSPDELRIRLLHALNMEQRN